MPNNKTIKILDGLIYFFIILFLVSLTNSIFVNQIGYYFALIFILIRFSVTKENQFQKTGLEIAFIWFLTAEILSAIFSQQHGQAFYYALKRALLIPLVYTMIAATHDLDRAKKYFIIYIGASLITVLIYLFFAYRYLIYNLYSVEGSGPSLFQYPITAAEILSFSVIFLFAFLLNEKTTFSKKVMLALGFAFSLLALVSTYKRGAWLGVISGIFVVLLLRKNWKLIIFAALLVIVAFLTQKNISEIKIYKYPNGKLQYDSTLKTKGRAYSLYFSNGDMYVSDYNDGLLKYRNDTLLYKKEFPSPVVAYFKWKEGYFVARLIDTRLFLLKMDNGILKKKGELLTPGFTTSCVIKNNFLYVLDSDSGLTIFKDPDNINDSVRFGNLRNGNTMYVDSTIFVIYAPPRNIALYKINNGLPGKLLYDYKSSVDIDYVFYNERKLFVSDAEGLKLFNVDSTGLKMLDKNKSMIDLFSWDQSDGKLFACNLNGDFYELNYPVGNKIKVLSHGNIGFYPESISYYDGRMFFTRVKRSRLLSIFDPYLPSNYVRFELWKAGWKMFKDHPVFGVGDIDLQKLYKEYKKPYDKEIQGHMHNNFVHVLVVLGLFGFIAFCFLIIKIIKIEWNIWRETKGKAFISSYALGAFAGFIAFLIAGLTEMNYGDHEIITLVWFTLGLDIVLYNFFKKDKSKKELESGYSK
jgi:hypothetical protein